MRILSTKLLTSSFKNRLVQKGFSLVEFPFIKIEPHALNIDSLNDNILITSQNTVRLALNDSNLKSLMVNKKYFCVGEKTKALLEENDKRVVKMSKNGSFLSKYITANHKNESFSFLCGRQRRPEIEIELAKKKVSLTLHEIYNTIHTPKTVETKFDGVLFFSPSAVESYFKTNTWKFGMQGFCIGSSTAASLSNYTKNFSVAKFPNENQLLLSIHKYYSHDYDKK